MAQNDLYLEFVNKLKKEKTPEEIAQFILNLAQFSAETLYITIVTQLSDQDMAEIDKIKDEKKAEEELIRRFKKKTGLTPEQFVVNFRDRIAAGQLFPELQQMIKDVKGNS